MQDELIQINPKAALKVRKVGKEGTPLIIIDDFAQDTTAVIDYACDSANYGPDTTSAYPGVRAKLPRDYVITVLNAVYRLLFQVYSVPANLGMKPVNTVYSVITRPEEDLEVKQRLPHFDSNGPYYLAILHYLQPGDFCGTGLFRHRPTGYEKILENRSAEYHRSQELFLSEHGNPPRKYIRASDDHYELYDQIDYQPNRLVVYPGSLLHSGLVIPEVDIDPNPQTGRLTANVFVNFQ